MRTHSLREQVLALKGVWEGDYAHDGEFWSFPATTSSPKPLQRPHPPLWIAARDISSHEFAVAQGCNVMVTPLWNPDEEVENLIQKFNGACTTHSDIPRPKIMLLRHSYVAESQADAEDAAKDLSRFYCYFSAWFKNERPISQGFIEPFTEEEIAAQEMFTPEKMRRNNVIGTPEEVIDRLKRYEELGYDQYGFWIDSGMSHERKKQSLERFIAEVMPAFA